MQGLSNEEGKKESTNAIVFKSVEVQAQAQVTLNFWFGKQNTRVGGIEW